MAEIRKNFFASATTFAELQAMYASATSPENLSANVGGSSPTEVHARYVQISTDFEKRNLEIGKSLMGIPSSTSSVLLLKLDS